MQRTQSTTLAGIAFLCLVILALLALGCGSGNRFTDPENTPGAAGPPDSSPGGSDGPQRTIKVVNKLFSPVRLAQDGKALGTAGRVDSVIVTVPLDGGPLRWDMIQSRNTAGDPVGEPLGYHFVVTASTPSRVIISNTVNGEKYFAIMLSNRADDEVEFGVNMGLGTGEKRWERRCGCTLEPDSPLTYFGYYRLLEGSNIRVYPSGANYSGPYDTWLRFSHQVDNGSGILLLNIFATPGGGNTAGGSLTAAGS
ncbi:MAG: hypothetical protein HKN20_00025 [Gemmatimonadetes bacterium]|nr:hypothetical protein [Gemmatimonadota bacterium]